jgi:acylphosphatase
MLIASTALNAIGCAAREKYHGHRRRRRKKQSHAADTALVKSRVCGSWAGVVHDDQSTRRFYVSGMVQGVGYRYFVQRAAQQLKLAGCVRNLSNGSVEVYAIGPAATLAILRRELERGPQGAIVSGVAEEEASHDSRYAHEFSIEYDA